MLYSINKKNILTIKLNIKFTLLAYLKIFKLYDVL